MKLYTIQNTVEADQWRLGLADEEEKRARIIERYGDKMDKFWGFVEPLHLELWFWGYNNPSYKDLGFCDAHSWLGNIVIDPPLHGRPLGNLLIMSEFLKETIEEFQFPNHRFYSLNVKKRGTGEVRMYYILHLLDDHYKELFYPRVSFSLRKKGEIIHSFSPGVIKDYSDFLGIRAEKMSRERFISLTADNIIYKTYYDFIWPHASHILVSQKVIDKLNTFNLRGVYFEEHKESILFE